jgi:hypothetical protein
MYRHKRTASVDTYGVSASASINACATRGQRVAAYKICTCTAHTLHITHSLHIAQLPGCDSMSCVRRAHWQMRLLGSLVTQ